MPLLSHITALDWDIPTPYFNNVFFWTDLSSLQRLYILLDVISEVVPWFEALTVDQRCANCFFPRLQTIYIKSRIANLGELKGVQLQSLQTESSSWIFQRETKGILSKSHSL